MLAARKHADLHSLQLRRARFSHELRREAAAVFESSIYDPPRVSSIPQPGEIIGGKYLVEGTLAFARVLE